MSESREVTSDTIARVEVHNGGSNAGAQTWLKYIKEVGSVGLGNTLDTWRAFS